jgi:hypothetical protein
MNININTPGFLLPNIIFKFTIKANLLILLSMESIAHQLGNMHKKAKIQAQLLT